MDLYADLLFDFARSRVNDPDLAQDLVQDCFLSAIRSFDHFAGKSSVQTWLISILKRKIIDYYRSAYSRVESINDLGFGNTETYYFEEEDGHWTKDAAPSEMEIPSHNLESKELNGILQKCIEKLPEKCKMVFAMKYLDELESEQICKELNLSSSNYWVIMHRAKLQLRECIQKNWK